MADAVEVFVKPEAKAGQKTGDWIVKVGRGRGGKNISRHRQKEVAVRRGRTEGKNRKDRPGGALLKVQNTDGGIRTEASYGNASARRGLFGLFG